MINCPLPRLITGWYLVIFVCPLGRTIILIGVNQLESWWCNVPLVVSMATINSHRVVFSHGDLLGSKKTVFSVYHALVSARDLSTNGSNVVE
jgi:hypothetical protein